MATSKVRFSNDTPTWEPKQRFSWEYPVPDTQFWNNLPFVVGRNFLSNFSPEEIEALPIKQDSVAPRDEKLVLLNGLLHKRLDEKNSEAAPNTFYDADYPAWDRLWLGIFTIEQELNLPAAETTMQMLCDRRKDESNLSHFHTLAGLLLARGKYVDAEEIEKKVLVWLENKLGEGSPQALGAWRIIFHALWVQGSSRREEAKQLMTKMETILAGLGNGQYVTYQEDEKRLLQDLRTKLQMEDGVFA